MIANASIASDQETVVFLSSEGARLAEEGYADDMHEEGFASLKELITNYAEAGGSIWVCSPCTRSANSMKESSSRVPRSWAAPSLWSTCRKAQAA